MLFVVQQVANEEQRVLFERFVERVVGAVQIKQQLPHLVLRELVASLHLPKGIKPTKGAER